VNSDDSSSELHFQVEMKKNGSIEFEYKVDAEMNYDYFSFLVNGKTIFQESQQLSWKKVKMELEKGFHQLRWIFKKDYSLSSGEDIARIKFISIHGSMELTSKCSTCPAGSFSLKGSVECKKCPKNTFSKYPGSADCESCPFGQESFEGSTDCFSTDLPCTLNEMYHSYSPCQSLKRSKFQHYIQPVLCNISNPNSIPLNEPQLEDCSLVCDKPGQAMNITSMECYYCSIGQFKSITSTSCESCEKGNEIKNSNFYLNLDSKWHTGCHGNCKSNGWRYMWNKMDSGVGNGESVSWLSIPLNQSQYLTLEYQLSCLSGSELHFTWNSTLIKVISCSGCSQEMKNVTIGPFKINSELSNHLRVSFVSDRQHSTNSSCNRAVLHHVIQVNAPSLGGGVNCLPCFNGTSEMNHQCQPCSAGTFTPNDNTPHPSCLECDVNTFSYSNANQCKKCPNGFTSKKKSSKCEWKSGKVNEYGKK
jgi:hypothetical protein